MTNDDITATTPGVRCRAWPSYPVLTIPAGEDLRNYSPATDHAHGYDGKGPARFACHAILEVPPAEPDQPVATPEQLAAWHADGQKGCPVCGDDPTTDHRSYGPLEIDGDVWQPVECLRCGSKWHLIYELTGVDPEAGEGSVYPLPLAREMVTREALHSILDNCAVWQSRASKMSAGDFLDLIENIAADALKGKEYLGDAPDAKEHDLPPGAKACTACGMSASADGFDASPCTPPTCKKYPDRPVLPHVKGDGRFTHAHTDADAPHGMIRCDGEVA